jgi:hypothetical protein
MNDPTSILEQSRRRNDAAGKRGIVAATARRCASVLALVLLFLTMGVGSMPSLETGARGLTLKTTSKPARADTFVDQGGHYQDLLSTRTRHKTH